MIWPPSLNRDTMAHVSYHQHNWADDICDACSSWPQWARDLAGRLDQLTATLEQQGEQLMADLTGLAAAVDAETKTVGDAVTLLNDLSGKVASGGVAEQAELDAITAKLTGSHTALTAALAADSTTPAPAPAAGAPSGPPAVASIPTGNEPVPVAAPPAGANVIPPVDGSVTIVPTNNPAAVDPTKPSIPATPLQAGTPPAGGVLPLYKHVGTGSFDAAEWPSAGVGSDGAELYHFAGDTAGQPPTGASADWTVA